MRRIEIRDPIVFASANKPVKYRASEIGRFLLCPGWSALHAQIRANLPAIASDIAESGTRIHAMVAAQVDESHELPDKITDDESDIALVCAGFAEDEIQSFAGDEVGRTDYGAECECYLDCGDFCVSGHIDLWAFTATRALVIDWKTGWGGIPVGGRMAQAQVSIYGAALAQAQKVEVADVVIFEPRTRYAHRAKVRAQPVIDMCVAVDAAQSAHDRRPGVEQCKYCPCAPLCPELGEAADRLGDLDGQAVDVYDVGELGRLVDAAKLCEIRYTSVMNLAKTAAAMGHVAHGYKWVTVKGRHKTGTPEIAKVLAGVVPMRELAAASSVSKPKALELFKRYYRGDGSPHKVFADLCEAKLPRGPKTHQLRKDNKVAR